MAAMAAKRAPAKSVAPVVLPPDPLPKQGAPAVPVGFEPPPKHQKRIGLPPTEQQVRDAPDVARELTTSPTYAKDFGARVPDAKTIGDALTLAKGWSDQVGAAEAWLTYVKAQEHAAWREAFALTKKLKPEFELAAKHDPAVSTTYPQTEDFLGVRVAAARRAVKTRAENEKKKAPQPKA
jgi:hypothetical protein